MDTPKVFIPNLSNHNFIDAKRYGQLVFITKGEQAKYSVNSMARCWAAAMEDSKPTDYILLTSLNILCCIGCGMFAAKHKKLNILLWRRDRYIVREIIFNVEAELDLHELIKDEGDY